MPDEPVPAEAKQVSAPAESADDAANYVLAQRMSMLYQRGVRGANWFYWIGALSLVNTLILHSGAQMQFIVGLGITFVCDAIALGLANRHPESAAIIQGVAIGFAVIVSLVVVLFGWLANRGYKSAFIIGMILYALDGLLWIMVEDWLCVGFHVFALWSLATGLSGFWQLEKLQKEVREQARAVANFS